VASIGNDLEHGHQNGFDVEGVVGCLDSCVGMIAGRDEMGEDHRNYDCMQQKVEAMQARCWTMYSGLCDPPNDPPNDPPCEDQEEVQKLAPEDLKECLGIGDPEPEECTLAKIDEFCKNAIDPGSPTHVCADQDCSPALPDGWFECGFATSAGMWTLHLTCTCLDMPECSPSDPGFTCPVSHEGCFGSRDVYCENSVAFCGFAPPL
jgi:hypothetical protein